MVLVQSAHNTFTSRDDITTLKPVCEKQPFDEIPWSSVDFLVKDNRQKLREINRMVRPGFSRAKQSPKIAEYRFDDVLY